MSKPTVYLAGPIQHVNDYGKGWRERIKARSDKCEWVDPLAKYNSMKEAEAEWTREDIVENDLDMIYKADALLVHWELAPTAGTPMEMFYAYWYTDNDVVVQTTVSDANISPWITYHSDAVVETFDEAIEVLT